MKITVIYLEPFLSLTQKREEEMKLEEGVTINSLANRLSRQYGEEFSKFAGYKDTYPATVFFREGETLNLSRETILKDGDRIVIAMPVGGG